MNVLVCIERKKEREKLSEVGGTRATEQVLVTFVVIGLLFI